MLSHTNHPLWWADDSVASSRTGTGTGTSQGRLRALEAGLSEVRSSGSAAPLLSTTSTGLCVQPTNEREMVTFCSAEFVLSAPPVVRVALGRPNMVEWRPAPWAGAAVGGKSA
jgi:hypothetical protein